MNSYESAWAYLQGALEALTPLLNEASASAIKERLMEAAQVGRGLSLMNDIPEPETTPPQPGFETPVPPSTPNSGSVFFPHDLQRAGNGTFTPPEPTEEEIEELLRRRSGG